MSKQTSHGQPPLYCGLHAVICRPIECVECAVHSPSGGAAPGPHQLLRRGEAFRTASTAPAARLAG